MTAGTFDAGYTLEPNASTMRKLGVATTLEAGVIAQYVLGDPERQRLRRRLRAHHRLHQEPAGRRQALHRRLGEGGRLINDEPEGGAQASRQEHVHARRRGRYRADDPLLHGQGSDRQGQGGLPEVHRLLGARPARCPRRSTSPSICRRSDERGGRWARRSCVLRTDAAGAPIGEPPPGTAAARHHPRPDQALRRRRDLRPLRPRHPARQADLGVRAERLRQEHADQHDRRAHSRRRRRDPVRRQAARTRSSSATCSRTIARRCFPGCARSTTSSIRSS